MDDVDYDEDFEEADEEAGRARFRADPKPWLFGGDRKIRMIFPYTYRE